MANPRRYLPADAQYVRRAPVGFSWSLYYSPRMKLYYKLTPTRSGGYTVQTGGTLASCCGKR